MIDAAEGTPYHNHAVVGQKVYSVLWRAEGRRPQIAYASSFQDAAREEHRVLMEEPGVRTIAIFECVCIRKHVK